MMAGQHGRAAKRSDLRVSLQHTLNPALLGSYPTPYSAFCHNHRPWVSGKLKPVSIRYQHDTAKIKSGFTGFDTNVLVKKLKTPRILGSQAVFRK